MFRDIPVLQLVHSHPDTTDIDAITERTIDTFLTTHADLFTPYDELIGDYNHLLEQPTTVEDIKIKLPKCRNAALMKVLRILKAVLDIASSLGSRN